MLAVCLFQRPPNRQLDLICASWWVQFKSCAAQQSIEHDMSYEELWSGVNSNSGRIFERWVTRVNSDIYELQIK